MIAKLIACDRSREQALARMGQALSEYRIAGVANNVEFLARLVTTPSFVAADLDMALIERRQVFFEGRAWPLALVDTLNVGGAGEAAKGGRKAPCPAR